MQFESFNKAFFIENNSCSPIGKRTTNIKWYNNKGLLDLQNGNIAEITIVTHGVHETWAGYQVEIVNVINGKITSHYFGFNDFMAITPNDGFCVMGSCCQDNVAKWYIQVPTPSQRNKMASTILDFCKQFL